MTKLTIGLCILSLLLGYWLGRRSMRPEHRGEDMNDYT